MIPPITIPRQPNESNRAYAARVEYVTAGPQRDLRSLAQKLNKSLTIVGRWSGEYGWVESARQYDDTVAALAIQQAGEQYIADLEGHRKSAMQYGQALCGVAAEMLAQLRNRKQELEYTPAALATIARALTTGMDLQAHALRLAELLPKITTDGNDRE